MAKKKAKAKGREMLSREGQVTGWRTEVMAYPFEVGSTRRERRAIPSISVLGAFVEPVKGVTQFDITFTPGAPHIGNAEIPCVGVILKAKPAIEGHVTLAPIEFQTLLALVTTNNLRYLACDFQEPKYGHALMSSILFGSENPA